MAGTVRAVVARREELTRSVVEVRLRPVEPPRVPFLAGQHFLVRFPGSGAEVPYSAASEPADPEIRFLAKREDASEPGRLASLGEGDPVAFRGPFGAFVLDAEPSRDALFLAMGTGIAPIRAMVRHLLLRRGRRARVELVFGLRSEAEVFWDDEFRSLAREQAGLAYTLTLSRPGPAWPGRRGRVTAWLDAEAERLAGRARAGALEAWICGSAEMVSQARERLAALGLGPGLVHSEEQG